ncbi:M12 family metallo-peptidase [Aquimarina sediminis]|uniref:M12 family metallo-peptidase n=1 Tax=Aquimarina sediminis TaxID=2070536 RepID=UPI000CA06672|nr:M12 family metallo-peptidase [Aquimarina sediminis]
MKRILAIAITFFTVMSFAQTQLHKPSELVAQQKSLGSNFESTQLFTSINQQKNQIQVPKGLKDYVLFAIDQSKMKSLQGNFPSTMNLDIPGQKSAMSLDLVKVNIRTDDYVAIEMPSGKSLKRDNIAHYRGVVREQPNSLVAISFYDNKISGFISIEGQDGNMVVGPVENSKSHILYKDKEISFLYELACQVEDDPQGYTIEELADTPKSRAAAKCPRVFFDIGTDVVNDKGGSQGASNYIEGLFNQVAALYANDQISIKLSGTKAWTSNQPFSNNLDSYISYKNRNGLNGDLGHFVTYNYSGGVAGGIGTLCNSSRNYAVSGIRGSYSNIPTYSFDVFLVSHELGHNVGSRHTHACVWNGNNTAIDGCAGFTEGNCSIPGNPSGGGTIMSYCPNTSVGVNFNKGFGSQPRNVIQNYIGNSSCLQTCNGGGCSSGDPISVTFTNNTDCTLQYYRNNSLQGSANAGGSYAANTTVGSAWQAKKSSGETVDNFTIACNQTTYNSSGNCSSGGGNCDGVAPWSPNVNYSIGDRVTYNGNLYERTASGWQNLGPCTTTGDPCAGVAPWSSTVNYSVGDRVTYNGSLYERTATGWKNLGPCGAAFTSFDGEGPALGGDLSFITYPNPAKNLLNLEISNLKSSSAHITIKDMNGRALEIVELKSPPGGIVVRKVIDISKLSTGIYFVQINTGTKTLTQKIFIK